MNSKELIKEIRKHKGKIMGVLEYAEMYVVIEKKDFIETLKKQEREWKIDIHEKAEIMFINIDKF